MEQFSVAYVRAVAALARCSPGTREVDMESMDITLTAHVPDGTATTSPQLDIQLKCTASKAIQKKGGLRFPLKIKNYNDLTARTLNQRLLVVLCVPQNVADWVEQSHEMLCLKKCAYWLAPSEFPASGNKTSVTVAIPYTNMFSPEFLTTCMKTLADGGAL
jgi:hypothetical protein